MKQIGPLIVDGDTGQPVELRGYAILFGSPTAGLDRHQGLPELFLPESIRNDQVSGVYLTRSHNHDDPIRGDLELSATNMGVMWRMRNIEATAANMDTIERVRAEGMGCSFTVYDMLGRVIDWAGLTVFAVAQVSRLAEICVTENPVNPKTGCWVFPQAKYRTSQYALRFMWDADANHPGTEWIAAKGPEA